MSTLLLPLDTLLFGPSVPAGMDWSVIGKFTCVLRKTADPCDPPIVVRHIPGTSYYRLIDGRHRVMAAIMAGRTHIDAIEPG